jgi:ankyrin repeat protein
MRDGFAWACQFGRTEVVDFLLQRGMQVDAKLRHGETGLHRAAYGGHALIVRLLLDRGAPIDVKDDRYDGTPLDWALHAGHTSDSGMLEALKGKF